MHYFLPMHVLYYYINLNLKRQCHFKRITMRNLTVFFSSLVVWCKYQVWYKSSSSCSSSPLHFHHCHILLLPGTWPFRRMQLGIFVLKRNNEVSSVAKNEPVVLCRGHRGLGWMDESLLCTAKHLQRYFLVTDMVELG